MRGLLLLRKRLFGAVPVDGGALFDLRRYNSCVRVVLGSCSIKPIVVASTRIILCTLWPLVGVSGSRRKTTFGILIVILGFIPSRSQPVHPGFLSAVDVRLRQPSHAEAVNPTVPEPERSVSIFRAREKKKRCGFISVSAPH